MNPLNALGIREPSFLPAHFVKTTIDKHNHETARSWITHKLFGRFCIIEAPGINENNTLTSTTIVAFENDFELTYFLLACPYTRR